MRRCVLVHHDKGFRVGEALAGVVPIRFRFPPSQRIVLGRRGQQAHGRLGQGSLFRVVRFEPAADELDGLGVGEVVPEAVRGHDDEIAVLGFDFGGRDDGFGGKVWGGETAFPGRRPVETLCCFVLNWARPFPAAVAKGTGHG